jgi:hypothetical protein
MGTCHTAIRALWSMYVSVSVTEVLYISPPTIDLWNSTLQVDQARRLEEHGNYDTVVLAWRRGTDLRWSFQAFLSTTYSKGTTKSGMFSIEGSDTLITYEKLPNAQRKIPEFLNSMITRGTYECELIGTCTARPLSFKKYWLLGAHIDLASTWQVLKIEDRIGRKWYGDCYHGSPVDGENT